MTLERRCRGWPWASSPFTFSRKSPGGARRGEPTQSCPEEALERGRRGSERRAWPELLKSSISCRRPGGSRPLQFTTTEMGRPGRKAKPSRVPSCRSHGLSGHIVASTCLTLQWPLPGPDAVGVRLGGEAGLEVDAADACDPHRVAAAALGL